MEKPPFDVDESDSVVEKADDAGVFMLDLLKFKKQVPVPAMTSVIDRLSKATDSIDSMSEPLQCESVPGKQLKETHMAKKVELVKNLMRKYNRINEEELLNEVMRHEDPQDLLNYHVLFTGPYIRTIQAQAISEMWIENNLIGYSYIDKFIDECPSPIDVLSVEETAQLHLNWCSDQGIDCGDLMVKLYCVLAKNYAKINCFMMQCQSNAGKTYWTLPVMCFPDLVGQTIQSQDFANQRCLFKEVIQIPELSLSKPEQVEEAKIFEGLPTTVNVKNKEPHVLERTPVILICNNHPWKFFNEEMSAFLNRMFAFQNLHKSPMLDGKKGPNPKYYRLVFEFIRNEIATMPEFPCMPSDEPMWATYCELTGSFIQSIIVMKDIDLSHILESPTMQNTYLKVKELHPRVGLLGWRAQERLNCSYDDLLSEIYTWIYWVTRPGSEDYYFLPSQKQIVLYSGFAEGIYDAEQDLDYEDYISMRSGYSHIKRMLLKLRTWPEVVDEKSSLSDTVKFILKGTLKQMANYIAEFLKENREKIVALRQAWVACEVPPTEEVHERYQETNDVHPWGFCGQPKTEEDDQGV